MSNPQRVAGDQHPEQWQRDLNPEPMAGQNRGVLDDQGQKELQTAYDIKDIHELLGNLTDDNLRQIPILPHGMRLQQGATYVDLHDPARTVFKARGDMMAEAHNWYVPKSEVDYQLWNEIIGVTEAARLDAPEEDATS